MVTDAPLGDLLVVLIPSCLGSVIALGCLAVSIHRSFNANSKSFREKPLEEKLHVASHILLVAFNVAIQREALRIVAPVGPDAHVVIYAFNSLLFLISWFVRFLSIRRFVDVLSTTLGFNRRWGLVLLAFTTVVFAIAVVATVIALASKAEDYQMTVDLISAVWGFVLAVIITGVVGAVTKVVMKVKEDLVGATRSSVTTPDARQDRINAGSRWLTMQKYTLFGVFAGCVALVIFCTAVETVGTTSESFPRTGVIQLAIDLYCVALLYVEHIIKDVARWDVNKSANDLRAPSTLKSSRGKPSEITEENKHTTFGSHLREFIRISTASRATKLHAIDTGATTTPLPPLPPLPSKTRPSAQELFNDNCA